MLLALGVLVGVAVASPVSAASSTKVTWNVSSLMPGEARSLWAVVSTNSSGVKTWSKKGTCKLTPTRKPTKLTMGTTGSCVLTLKVAKSKKYPAKTSRKTITLVTPATTMAPTTTLASTCVTGGTCAVGNAGPGGGTVFYVAPSDFTSAGSACGTACRYLEVAALGWITADTPAGQTNCLFLGSSFVDPRCGWSGTWTMIGTTGTGIGTGYANTSAMISQSNTAGKAGAVARAFQGGGKTDWFLPSKDELNALCKWAFNDTVNAICNQNGIGTLQRTNGDFASSLYWSSTEIDAVGAGVQAFDYGLQHYGTKSNPSAHFVRPVRAF